MTKPFLSIDEQIDLLISRKIHIDDNSTAKKYLLTNNYYNVINMYGKFFYVPGSQNQFLDGTNLNEIIATHYFEQEFRSALLKGILTIESTLRSIVSYTFSSHHKNQYDYLNTSNFDQKNIFETTRTLSKIVDKINKAQREKGNSIIHYEKNHGCIPLWVLVSYIDFGTLENFYKNMLLAEREEIAKHYSNELKSSIGSTIPLTPVVLSSFLANIRELRNVLAHDNKLIRFKCIKNAIYFKPIHNLFNINANSSKQDVYNVFVIMRALMIGNDFAIMNNKILKMSKRLNVKLNVISINEILGSYGFPIDWYLSKKMTQIS